MLDFMRDRGRTTEDKRREALSAYLDNMLTPRERDGFEAQLARDAQLRAELEQLRVLRLQLRNMPRRRVPRSFALDPAVYGRPKSQPLLQLYPVLRGATAITAILLIFTLALGAFDGQSGGVLTPAPAAEVSMFEEAAVEEAAVEEAAPAALSGEEGAPIESAAPASAADDQRDAETAPAPDDTALESVPAQPGITAEETVAEDLALQQAVPELEGTPAALATAEPAPELENADAALSDVEATVTPDAIAAVDETTSVAAETAEEVEAATQPWLLPVQLALAVAFVILLVLWLFARRRVRAL